MPQKSFVQPVETSLKLFLKTFCRVL